VSIPFSLLRLPNGVDRTGGLFWQCLNFRDSLRKPRSQLFVGFHQGPTGILLEPPLAIRALARKRRAYPVLNRSRHNPDGLRCLCFFSDYQQGLRASSLTRRAEPLDFPDRHLIQKQVIHKRAHIAWLRPHDLGGRVLYDAWAIRLRLVIGSDKILKRLRDAPNT